MAVAVFPRCRRGGWGLVKRLASWAIRRTTGQVLSEPLSGQRVLRRELVGLLRYAPRGFGVEMGVARDVYTRGCNILAEKTPRPLRERGKDPASIWHRLKQLLAILREIYLRRELL